MRSAGSQRGQNPLLGGGIGRCKAAAQLLTAPRQPQRTSPTVGTVDEALDYPHALKLIDDLSSIYRRNTECICKAALINPRPVVDGTEHRPLQLRQPLRQERFRNDRGADLLKAAGQIARPAVEQER